jgi:kumamolisin
MQKSNRVNLKGSERAPLAGAHSVGATDPHQLIEISVILKHRKPVPSAEQNLRRITHAEFAAEHGANPADLELLKKFADENSLQVLERGDEIMRRSVTVAGTAANMEKAFGVKLEDYEHPEGSYRGRTGSIQIPADLENAIQGVFGLDDRPAAKPHYRYRTAHSGSFGERATASSYSPAQVAQAYHFPAANAAGQTIGILELGGGYRPADLETYFKGLGLQNPNIKSVSVDHGKNRPTNANSSDGEVMLDIEVAAAVAQGANIVVYFTPNTDRGFQDALSTAIHDEINKPSVISISWGGAESTWTTQAMTSMDQIAAEAAALGVTITVATGDNGSGDSVNDGQPHADFPASSPNVLACGGTSLQASGTTIKSETVWNDGAKGGATGGGYSTQFPRPAYQSAVVTQQHRGIPDVSGDADPETGYDVRVDGQNMVVGGTSAVAPLWAGLIAVLNNSLGTRLGFVNPQLYAINQKAGFHDITKGTNGAFKSMAGWDACTGLGSPDATGLLDALKTTTQASNKKSSSKQHASAD